MPASPSSAALNPALSIRSASGLISRILRHHATVSCSSEASEAADLWTGLAESSIVGGDGQVANDMEHVASADRIAGDHRDDGLGQPPDLDLEVEHIEPPDALGIDVAVVASNPLVAAGAERLGAGPGEDDDANLLVVARRLESLGHLRHRYRSEGVADLRAVDRDLGDAVRGLVDDVLVVA